MEKPVNKRAALAGGLLVLITALLGAPALIGADAERRFCDLVALPGYDVIVDRYERGWFAARVHWHLQPQLPDRRPPQVAAAPAAVPATRGASDAGAPRWGFVTAVRHGPLLAFGWPDRVAAAPLQPLPQGQIPSDRATLEHGRPLLGYVAFHSRLDADATPAWRHWLGAAADAAHADVTYGLWSGFSAHAWLPAVSGRFSDGAMGSAGGVEVSAEGTGDAGVQVAARVARANIAGTARSAPFTVDGLVLAGDIARAGASPWVWVGTITARAGRVGVALAATPLTFSALHVKLFSRLEDAGLMAAIVESHAAAISVGAQQFGATQATFVAKSLSAVAIARSLQLQALRSARGSVQDAAVDLELARWRTDVLPGALQLSPVLVLTRAVSIWAGEPLWMTGRAQFDGTGVVPAGRLSDKAFWLQHITAEISARFANAAAQRAANVWLSNDNGDGQATASGVASLPAMARLGRLVPTQHGYVANFVMQSGQAALNGQTLALPGTQSFSHSSQETRALISSGPGFRSGASLSVTSTFLVAIG